MRHLFIIGIWVLALTLPAVAAELTPLHLVPPDSQIILEVHDGAFFHSIVQEAGMEPQLVAAVRDMLAENNPEKAKGFGTEQLRLLMDARLVVSFSLFDRGEQMPGVRMFAALEFNDPQAFLTMAEMFTPRIAEGYIASSMGPFTIYESRQPVTARTDEEGQPARTGEHVWMAMGQQMMILTVGDDFAKRLASYLAGRQQFAWQAMTFPGEEAGAAGTLMRCRVVTDELKYAIKAPFMRALEEMKKPDEEEGGEAANEEQSPASPLDVSPDAILKFVEGIGLGQIEEGTLVMRRDGENLHVTAGMAVDRSRKMIGRYLQGLVGRSLSAYRMLPADSVAFNDMGFWDFGLFYQLLADLVKESFGPQGESMMLTVEAMVPLQTGLSLRNDLLPVLGNEHGLVMLPPDRGGDAATGQLPPAAFFFRPLKVEMVDKAVNAMEKKGLATIGRSTHQGKTVYEINLAGDDKAASPAPDEPGATEPATEAPAEPADAVTQVLQQNETMHLLILEPLVFVSPQRAVLEHIVDEGLKGNTLANSPLFGDMVARVPPGCIQLAATDMQGLNAIWDSVPADLPLVGGLKSLLAGSGTQGVSTQQLLLVDEGLVGHGQMPLASFREWMKGLLILLLQEDGEQPVEQTGKQTGPAENRPSGA